MKNLHQLLLEYGESHQNETNKLIHWICVPAIFFSITGFMYGIKLPYNISGMQLNVAVVFLLILTVYYARLSKTLWVGMLLFGLVCLFLCHLVEQHVEVSLWTFSLLLFIAAWVGQFYGHKVEGKKPSFLKDLQFLLIGPAWLMHFIYKKMGIGI